MECFATDGELGVSDIARRLGVAKSTAHRLLQTLASRGFVEQDAHSGQYRLGMHVYELGALALARNELRHAALPFLRQVATATGLTVNLSVPDGPDVVFVERIENSDGVRILGHFGRRLPAHTTSSGKAIAAWNAEADLARRRAGFPPRVSQHGAHRGRLGPLPGERAQGRVRRVAQRVLRRRLVGGRAGHRAPRGHRLGVGLRPDRGRSSRRSTGSCRCSSPPAAGSPARTPPDGPDAGRHRQPRATAGHPSAAMFPGAERARARPPPSVPSSVKAPTAPRPARVSRGPQEGHPWTTRPAPRSPRALLAAYDSKEPLEPLTTTHEGMTLEDAYAIQLLQIEQRLAAGPHRAGPQGRPHQCRDAAPARRHRARLRPPARRLLPPRAHADPDRRCSCSRASSPRSPSC